MPIASKIFTGFRALGFVSDHVPLAVRHHKKHKENYVITCVGKSFHTYNCSRLGIVSVSDSHPENISCLATDANLVFTACKNVIQAFSRGRQVIHTYEGHEKDVHILLPFGNHLISIDIDNKVIVWDIENEGVYLEMQFSTKTFQITALMHPNTYLNKVVFGSKQGELQLWNLLKDKLIYTFNGWGSPVTVVEQSPAVDVVAVGLADGQVILHNLKYDESIVKFTQDWGPVTAISFRTDGHPVMATGSSAGHIALWNLEERKLQSQMRNAHETAVSGLKCMPSEPLMVTSAADNTLKVWIFDLPDGGGRLLRQRAGHGAPPNRLRHYGSDGKNILSAGQDSTLRSFSTLHDKHNKSLGRASYDKAESKKLGLKKDKHMMPAITQFAAEPSRQSDWDNIVACHRGICVSTTWSFQRSTMGHYKLQHERFQDSRPYQQTAVAQVVDISSCGNFTVIGYNTGHVDMYNLQSGIYRGSYGDPTAHSNAIRGVALDGLNQVTVTCDASGEMKFWRFKRKDLLDVVKLNNNVCQILLHRESSMLAVAFDDFSVYVIDMATRRVVRKFIGHQNSITDMTFSPDARWLVTASMDSTVRTWDMPTGYLVDVFQLDSAVTSLSMSPTGDFLVTSHVDDVGLYLWSNQTLYTHVPLKQLPADYQPVTIEMPTTQRKTESSDADYEDTDDYLGSEFKSPEQISDELVTLSLLPKSRWQNLLNLDTIKMRNKPKQPPKVPKAAPFFLPTISGLEPKFAAPEAEKTITDQDMARISLVPMTELSQMLSADDIQYDSILGKMKELGPSAIDIQIRSLSPESGGSIPVMMQFIKFIKFIITTRTHFELANAYLGLFLKIHGDIIVTDDKLTRELIDMKHCVKETWDGLQDLFIQNLCLINYMRTSTL